MGWLSYEATEFDKRGNVDRLAEMRKQYAKGTIIKDRMVGRVYYAAVNFEDGAVGIDVVLTYVQGNEFGYKAMDASMQPFYYDCPESILKLYSRNGETAMKWIAECRRRNELKKKLAKASIIKVALPCNTSVGDRGKVVTLARNHLWHSHWDVPMYVCYFPNSRIQQWLIEGHVEIIK